MSTSVDRSSLWSSWSPKSKAEVLWEMVKTSIFQCPCMTILWIHTALTIKHLMLQGYCWHSFRTGPRCNSCIEKYMVKRLWPLTEWPQLAVKTRPNSIYQERVQPIYNHLLLRDTNFVLGSCDWPNSLHWKRPHDEIESSGTKLVMDLKPSSSGRNKGSLLFAAGDYLDYLRFSSMKKLRYATSIRHLEVKKLNSQSYSMTS